LVSLFHCDVFITLLPQSYPMYPSISFPSMYHHNTCLPASICCIAISPLTLRIGSFGFGFTYLNSYDLTFPVYTYQTVHCSPALPSSLSHRRFSSVKNHSISHHSPSFKIHAFSHLYLMISFATNQKGCRYPTFRPISSQFHDHNSFISRSFFGF